MLEQSFLYSPWRNHAGMDRHSLCLWETLCWSDGYFLKKLWPKKSPHWSRFILKDCRPWEGPMLEQGIGDVKGQKKQKGAVMDRPQLSNLLQCKEGGKRWSGEWSEVKPGRKGWGEEKMLSFLSLTIQF